MIAFLFPGQGSQKVGMGRALADAFAEARAVFDEADAAYEQMWGSDAPTWARVLELADTLGPNRPSGRRAVRRDDLRARRG